MKKIISFLLGIVWLLWVVLAHQPRLVFDTMQQPVTISNPEISQAFYGVLSGKSDVYQIYATTGFDLYMQILVPDITWKNMDITMVMTNDSDNTWIFEWNKTEWTGFYEKYAWDTYLQSVALKEKVSSWYYLITVKNISNIGPYVLVVWEKERFPLSEIVSAMVSIPTLKSVFFWKNILSSYSNYVWLFLLIFLAIFLLLVCLWIIIIRKMRS